MATPHTVPTPVGDDVRLVINGSVVTPLVDTLEIVHHAYSPASASFSIRDTTGTLEFPDGQEVIVHEAFRELFGGVIGQSSFVTTGKDAARIHRVQCVDLSAHCTRKRLVTRVWEDALVGTALGHLIDEYLVDENVAQGFWQDGSITIDRLEFVDTPAFEVLNSLAEYCGGYIWRIRPVIAVDGSVTRELDFFGPGDRTTTVSFDDLNTLRDGFSLEYFNPEYRNVQKVVGPVEVGTTTLEDTTEITARATLSGDSGRVERVMGASAATDTIELADLGQRALDHNKRRSRRIVIHPRGVSMPEYPVGYQFDVDFTALDITIEDMICERVQITVATFQNSAGAYVPLYEVTLVDGRAIERWEETFARRGGSSTSNVNEVVTPPGVETDLTSILQKLYGVRVLTDGATVTLDYSTYWANRVTLAGNRSAVVGTFPPDGALVKMEVRQDDVGSRTVSWDADDFDFGTTGAPTLGTTAERMDVLLFYSTGAKLHYIGAGGVGEGFTPSPGEFDPRAIDGLQLWYTGDSETYVNNHALGTWHDQSGHGRDAIADDVPNRPTFKTNVINGLPALDFDGTDDELTIADHVDIRLEADSTIFAVLRLQSTSGINGIFSKADISSAAAGAYYLHTESGASAPVLDRPEVEAGVAASNGLGTTLWHYITVHVSGTTVSHFRDGFANGTDTLATGTATIHDAHIGRYRTDDWAHMQIAELLVYNEALTTDDRESVEEYLYGKYFVDPSQIDGLVAWYKADEITGLSDGDPIATWEDATGNGHDASSTASTDKPRYETGEVNGLPVVHFWGVDSTNRPFFDIPNHADLALNGDSSVFFVLKPDGNDIDIDTVVVLSKTPDTAGEDGAYLLYNPADLPTLDRPGIEGGVGAGTKWLPSAGFQVAACIVSGTSVTHRLAGATIGTDTLAAGEATTDVLRINRHKSVDDPNEIDHSHFKLAELIIYNVALDDDDRDAVESYLASKYGLT